MQYKRYDTIIFDLDGTLLNTLDDLADSVNAIMTQEGYCLRTKDEIREFIGDGAKSLIEKSLPAAANEEEILRCLKLFREHYMKHMQNQTKPYDGIMELLKELKGKGIKIGVVSNKPDEATKEVCRLYFGDLVNVAIGDNAMRKKKPDPDNVFAALTQLNSKRDKTLYVGDSNTDMITAQNAGLISVGVTWGYRSREVLLLEGADYIIDEPGQIVTLISEEKDKDEQ